jgi:trimeric autotransporter adhesin
MPANTGDLSFKKSGTTQVALLTSTGLNSTAIGATTPTSAAQGLGAGFSGAAGQGFTLRDTTNSRTYYVTTETATGLQINAGANPITLLGNTAITGTGSFSGNVGIGTVGPLCKTEVYDSAVLGAFVPATRSTWRVLQVKNYQRTNSGSAAGISFQGDNVNGDTGSAGIVGISTNTTGGVMDLAFLTAEGNTSLERMRVLANGNVGIGTTSPSHPLTILRRSGSTITEPLLNLQSQTSGSVDGDSYILYGTQAANWSAGVDQADSNKFRIEPASTLGGATGLAITTAGNVGIGTESPSVPLDVLGKAAFGSQPIASRALSNNGLLVYNAGNTVTSLGLYQSGQSSAHIGFTSASSTLRIVNAFAAGSITETTAIVLDSSGNVGIGTASPSAKIHVVSDGSQQLGSFINTAGADTALFGLYVGKYANDSTTSQRFIGFSINNDNNGNGQINANGASQAAFGSFSDARLKENIVTLDSQLPKILALRPVEFDYRDGSGHQIGFVAQEMQEIYPDAVAEADGYLTLTGFGKTEARIIKAVHASPP